MQKIKIINSIINYVKTFKSYMVIHKDFLSIKSWKKNPYLFLKSFFITFKFIHEDKKFLKVCKKHGTDKAYAMLDRRI